MVHIFYHIHQVAARVLKRIVWGALRDPHFGGRGGRRGHWWHHSRKSECGFQYALRCHRWLSLNHSASICNQMSPTI